MSNICSSKMCDICGDFDCRFNPEREVNMNLNNGIEITPTAKCKTNEGTIPIVLALLDSGYSIKEIAKKLNITPGTVRAIKESEKLKCR